MYAISSNVLYLKIKRFTQERLLMRFVEVSGKKSKKQKQRRCISNSLNMKNNSNLHKDILEKDKVE